MSVPNEKAKSFHQRPGQKKGQKFSAKGQRDEKVRYYPQRPDQRKGLKFSTQGQVDEETNRLKPRTLPKERVQKWEMGKKANTKARTPFHSIVMKKKEELLYEVAQASARGEMLCTEDSGLLEGENTCDITQWDIKNSSDEMTQQKIFELNLDKFGPYRMDYTRNGRHLLIGGQKGHIASFDWQAKKLHCEINVMENVNDVKWLHQETMFAVAQKKMTYIYDNQGIELHCLNHLATVQRLEFLPYHFLLVSANSRSYLSYLDISIGKEVCGIMTRKGRLDVMGVNPQSAVVSLGHSDGTVTFWIPSMKEPAAKLLCHGSGLRDLSFDATGKYMATTGLDRRLKIFDIRMYKELSTFQYQRKVCPGLVDFSQKGLLAVTRDNVVEVYKGMTELSQKPDKAFLYHRTDRTIVDINFCPYEDVLGLGHKDGFASIVIPGAGEANFDARESNPFQTKSQRKEAEVRMLLDKVRPEMISLDSEIAQVDLKTVQEQEAEKERTKFIKPDRIEYTPRDKQKGGSSGLKLVQRKKGHIDDVDREAIRKIVRSKQIEGKFEEQNKNRKYESALDRLRNKDE